MQPPSGPTLTVCISLSFYLLSIFENFLNTDQRVRCFFSTTWSVHFYHPFKGIFFFFFLSLLPFCFTFSKQRHIRLEGLGTNPIYCDCNARALQRWLKEKAIEATLYDDLTEVRCAAPDLLAGKLLAELPDEELTCEGRTTTTTTELEFMAGNITTTPYPDIITSSASEESSTTTSRPSIRQPQPTKTHGPYNMDHIS